MSPITIGLILGIYALLMWVMVFYVFHKGFKEWKSNRIERVQKFHAKVMDRRESSGYMVTFDYAGRQKEFAVGPEVYEVARIGQEGSLYLRGESFEGFQPKSESEKADDVYGRMVKR